MTTYSATQLANVGKLIGLILMLCGIQVDEQAMAGFLEVAGAILSALSIAFGWLHRWAQGDITFGGFRK